MYFSVCLAFAPVAGSGSFIKGGMSAWKHVFQKIEESNAHKNSADAYFLMAKKADVRSLLTGNQMSFHYEVKKKRQVVERICHKSNWQMWPKLQKT